MALHQFLSKNINTSGFQPNTNLPGKFFPPVQNPVQRQQAPPLPPQQIFNECDHSRSLTWADYQSAPPGATWGAMTASGIRVVNFNGKDLFQAYFDSSQSWVHAWDKTPTDNTVNGCQPTITAMEAYVRSHPGESVHYNRPAQVNCAATIFPRPLEVKTVGECTTVFGVECSRAKVEDSKRLLTHEKLHFDITCILVKKANDLLSAGVDFNVVYEGLISLYKKLNLDNGSGIGDYDTETNHGCDQVKQNEWQIKVGSSLPEYKISTIGDFLPGIDKNAG